jgi:hypothetical protein
MVPELRARGIGELLDVAVSMYRARFGRLVRLAALVVVPVQVVSSIVLLSAQPEGIDVTFTGTTSPQYDESSALVQFAASIVVLFVGFVSNAFVVGLCARPAADTYIGEDGSWKRGTIGGRNVGAVLAVATLVALLELAGIFACGVGFLVAETFLAVAVPVVVLERARPGTALGRSVRLTKRYFLRVLGTIVVAQLLISIVNVGLTAGLQLWFLDDSGTTALVISQGIAGAISSTLTTPLIATVAIALYFDLRIRNEAFDVQLLLQRRDARAATAIPSPAR